MVISIAFFLESFFHLVRCRKSLCRRTKISSLTPIFLQNFMPEFRTAFRNQHLQSSSVLCAPHMSENLSWVEQEAHCVHRLTTSVLTCAWCICQRVGASGCSGEERKRRNEPSPISVASSTWRHVSNHSKFHFSYVNTGVDWPKETWMDNSHLEPTNMILENWWWFPRLECILILSSLPYVGISRLSS